MFHWQNLTLYGRLAATLGLKGAVDWRNGQAIGRGRSNPS